MYVAAVHKSRTENSFILHIMHVNFDVSPSVLLLLLLLLFIIIIIISTGGAIRHYIDQLTKINKLGSLKKLLYGTTIFFSCMPTNQQD